MKAFFIFYFTLCTLGLHASSTEKLFDPAKNIEYFKLDNGLEVYLLSDSKAESTQIELEVKVGMEIENDANAGISHLVEHLIFRDQRVPHHDYLDYIKEEGATYVNAYTQRYDTTYMATIDSNKSYWITEVFAKMIFDKNVTEEDLEIEKGALQTEIGEGVWYKKWSWHIFDFINSIFPPKESFSRDNFSLSEARTLSPRYCMQENNKKFSLKEVMAQYKAYYYPSNMKLQIAGNFDMPSMKALIEKAYGKVQTTGTKTVKKPPYDAKLKDKPFAHYFEGVSENSGYIGVQYLVDTCQKNIILSAYMTNLALRIQQELRNKKGNTYGVSAYSSSTRGAGIAAIYFDGLHDDFEDNRAYIEKMLKEDKKTLTDEEIQKALKAYAIEYYTAIEHDSDTLMGLLSTSEHLRDIHDLNNSSHYELFRSISTENFRQVINETLVPEHYYTYLYRDYYFFPQDSTLIELLATILFFLLYFNTLRTYHLKKYGKLNKRDLLFSRRLSNRFMSFLVFVGIFFLSTLLWEWSKYLLCLLLTGDAYYLYTINVPYSYIITLLDIVFSLAYFFILYRYANYQSSLEVLKSYLYIMGSQYLRIEKSDISSFEVIKYKNTQRKQRIGISFFFWRPLVKMTFNDGSYYYLRTNNAIHLHEDLNIWHEAEY